jgi:hypothetical protein
VTDTAVAPRTPNSPYGGYPGLTRNGGLKLHQGLDDAGRSKADKDGLWKLTVETKFTGTTPGIVTRSGPAYTRKGEYLGQRVTIRFTTDGSTWESTTMHHREVLVKKGQNVLPGDPIAVGAGYRDQFKSPRAGAPHVHWTLKKDGVLVHPLSGEPVKIPKPLR